MKKTILLLSLLLSLFTPAHNWQCHHDSNLEYRTIRVSLLSNEDYCYSFTDNDGETYQIGVLIPDRSPAGSRIIYANSAILTMWYTVDYASYLFTNAYDSHCVLTSGSITYSSLVLNSPTKATFTVTASSSTFTTTKYLIAQMVNQNITVTFY